MLGYIFWWVSKIPLPLKKCWNSFCFYFTVIQGYIYYINSYTSPHPEKSFFQLFFFWSDAHDGGFRAAEFFIENGLIHIISELKIKRIYANKTWLKLVFFQHCIYLKKSDQVTKIPLFHLLLIFSLHIFSFPWLYDVYTYFIVAINSSPENLPCLKFTAYI